MDVFTHLLLLSLLSCLNTFVHSYRINSKIYQSIDSNNFCFRRMNATHQIGCNSKEKGNVGVVYIVEKEEDFKFVLETGPHYPYIAVIPSKDFNLTNMWKFRSVSERINGLIILEEEDPQSSGVSSYSPDKTCPNENFDLYSNDSTYGHCKALKWNPNDHNYETGLMFNDWPFPIFLIKNKTDIKEIRECFEKFGGPDWPLCSVQLMAPMNAAKDSVTCIRRTRMQKNSFFSLNPTLFCDPLGGTNIFNTLFRTSKSEKIGTNSTVVVSARLDSFSMFDSISPGADSAVTSLVTLLSIAHTLNQNNIKNDIRNNSNDKNVLFALFDGEAFDYIGSSRAVYDMSVGRFPVDPNASVNRSQIRTEHFSHFIELNQLGSHEDSEIKTLFMHKNIESNDSLTALQNIIRNNVEKEQKLEIKSVANGSPLPPSSLQSFLKYDKNIVGIVITNHEKEYTNKFYNSLYDDINNLNKTDKNLSKTLSNIATVISKSVYELLTGKKGENITANQSLIENMLECYLLNSACDLFRYVVSPEQNFPKEKLDPYPTYVGVYHFASLATASRTYTHLLFSYLTGDSIKDVTDQNQCLKLDSNDNLYSYTWMAGSSLNGTCIRSQAIKTIALSPAFVVPDDVVNSTQYSTWTESQWRASSARIFVKPSPLQEWITLIIGFIVLFLSFFAVYLVDKKSALLFESCNEIVPQQTIGC